MRIEARAIGGFAGQEFVGQVRIASVQNGRCVDVPISRLHLAGKRAMFCIEASDDLDAVIASMVANCTPVAITRQRGEGAVLFSASGWASIEETLYLQSSPKNTERLLASVRDMGTGAGVPLT